MHITVFAGKRSRSGTRHEPRASRHKSVDAQMATGMLTRIDAQTCAEWFFDARTAGHFFFQIRPSNRGFFLFPCGSMGTFFFCITQYSRAHCDELQKIFQILLAEDRAHDTVMLGHQVPKARGDQERQPTMNERNTLTPDRWETQGRNGPGCLPCQSLGGLPFPRQLTNPSPEGYSVLADSKPIGRWHTAKGNT